MKLYQKIREARSLIANDLGKSGNNSYDNYQYSTIGDYVRVVEKAFSQVGLVFVSSVEGYTILPPREGKTVQNAVALTLAWSIIDSETGEKIEGKSAGEAQDRGDKALYKAITGARKYALCCALNLHSEGDDPEADEKVSSDTAPAKTPVKPIPKKDVPKPANAPKPADFKQSTKPVKKVSENKLIKLAEERYREAEHAATILAAMDNIAHALPKFGGDLDLWEQALRAYEFEAERFSKAEQEEFKKRLAFHLAPHKEKSVEEQVVELFEKGGSRA